MKRLVFLSILLASATASEAMMQNRATHANGWTKWTVDDDITLMDIVDKAFQTLVPPPADQKARRARCTELNWKDIASQTTEKTNRQKTLRQCLERYKNFHDCENINEAWTPDEDARLLQLYQTHGRKWNLIAKFFDRPPNAMKNRLRLIQAGNTSKEQLVINTLTLLKRAQIRDTEDIPVQVFNSVPTQATPQQNDFSIFDTFDDSGFSF